MCHISFNFQHTQSYYITKFCKCYKNSAGLDRFALATLERELWPRRPVHSFMPHSLLKRLTKSVILIPRPLKKSSTHPLIYMVYGESDLSCSSNVGTCGKLLKSSDDNFDSKMFNAPGLEAGESCRAPQAITH